MTEDWKVEYDQWFNSLSLKQQEEVKMQQWMWIQENQIYCRTKKDYVLPCVHDHNHYECPEHLLNCVLAR